jgi:hypothetical protein
VIFTNGSDNEPITDKDLKLLSDLNKGLLSVKDTFKQMVCAPPNLMTAPNSTTTMTSAAKRGAATQNLIDADLEAEGFDGESFLRAICPDPTDGLSVDQLLKIATQSTEAIESHLAKRTKFSSAANELSQADATSFRSGSESDTDSGSDSSTESDCSGDAVYQQMFEGDFSSAEDACATCGNTSECGC